MVNPSVEGVPAKLKKGDEQVQGDQVKVYRISRLYGEVNGPPNEHEEDQDSVKNLQTIHPIRPCFSSMGSR